MGQDILQVRLLAPDAVHPHAANGVADQPQPRSRFHRLLLLRVAREDDLRSVAFGELENMMRLTGRQHPRLIDDNGGVSIDISMPPRAARRSSLSTQNGRASTSLPSATAVRHATAVAMMSARVHGRDRQWAAASWSCPSPLLPSMMATRPPDEVTDRIAAICSSLSG